ncbi:MAG: S1C family serine protease, partial [Anaerolineae bacterium]
VTNNHVVEGATEVRVALNDGSERPARVVGRDPATDVALLMVDAPRVPPPLVLGSSGTVQVGQMAVVIGSPFGLTQSLSAGYISARGRMLKSGDEYGTEIDDVLQTDAAVNPGNSGGPLLNAQGEVIGVTTAIFSTSRGFEGIGFAVPIATVKAVLPSLRLHGRVVRPFLGIAGLDITPQLARRFELPVAVGVLVQEVHAASAAEDAGVRAGSKRLRGPGGAIVLGGDVVTAVAGEPVRSMAEISRIVGQLAIGDAVTVTLARGSDLIDAVGTLGEHPPPD